MLIQLRSTGLRSGEKFDKMEKQTTSNSLAPPRNTKTATTPDRNVIERSNQNYIVCVSACLCVCVCVCVWVIYLLQCPINTQVWRHLNSPNRNISASPQPNVHKGARSRPMLLAALTPFDFWWVSFCLMDFESLTLGQLPHFKFYWATN